MNKYLFYNNDLGECYFTLSASIDFAWETIAECLGCEYTACNVEFISQF